MMLDLLEDVAKLKLGNFKGEERFLGRQHSQSAPNNIVEMYLDAHFGLWQMIVRLMEDGSDLNARDSGIER